MELQKLKALSFGKIALAKALSFYKSCCPRANGLVRDAGVGEAAATSETKRRALTFVPSAAQVRDRIAQREKQAGAHMAETRVSKTEKQMN